MTETTLIDVESG